ncbi:MAG: hypothetical protein FWF56_03505 [Firmicutes bacterium]|nr:hypothetical protein [Bacillota bacterium]
MSNMEIGWEYLDCSLEVLMAMLDTKVKAFNRHMNNKDLYNGNNTNTKQAERTINNLRHSKFLH